MTLIVTLFCVHQQNNTFFVLFSIVDELLIYIINLLFSSSISQENLTIL